MAIIKENKLKPPESKKQRPGKNLSETIAQIIPLINEIVKTYHLNDLVGISSSNRIKKIPAIDIDGIVMISIKCSGFNPEKWAIPLQPSLWKKEANTKSTSTKVPKVPKVTIISF